MLSIPYQKPQYYYWGAQEKCLFALTLISLIAGGIITSSYYHTWGSYCYLGVGLGSSVALVSFIILQCKVKIPALGLLPGITYSHLEYIESNFAKIAAKENVPNIEHVDLSSEKLRAFKIKGLSYIFKLSLANNPEQDITNRYNFAQKCRTHCQQNNLNNLFIPDSKLFRFGGRTILVQENLPSYAPIKGNLESYQPSALTDFTQACLLICELGVSRVLFEDIDFVSFKVNERENVKLSFINLEPPPLDFSKSPIPVIQAALFDPFKGFLRKLHIKYLFHFANLINSPCKIENKAIQQLTVKEWACDANLIMYFEMMSHWFMKAIASPDDEYGDLLKAELENLLITKAKERQWQV